jgi:transposase
MSSLVDSSTLKSFKRARKKLFNAKKVLYLEHVTFSVNEAIHKAFKEFLNELNEMLSLKQLLAALFTPRFPKIIVKENTPEEFLRYHAIKMKNAIRSELKTLFMNAFPDLLGMIVQSLSPLKNSLLDRVKKPTARRLSVQIQDSQNYKPNYDDLTTRLGLCRNEIIKFRINDKKKYRNNENEVKYKSRIQELLQHDNVTSQLPSLTLKGGKILMSLPFEIKTTDSSNQSYPSRVPLDPKVTIKVDLGLKHFAVLSVNQEPDNHDSSRDLPGSKSEIARYFIGAKQVFDQQFIEGSFKTYHYNRYEGTQLDSSEKRTSSHIFRKIRVIRGEITRIQQQKDAYKVAHPHDFRRKFKYYRLKKQLKLLWQRVHEVNRTIKNNVSHLIVQIACHHQAARVYFEDLKWSSHQKKARVGNYLSYMSAHWIHGQIQDQVKQQGKLHGITMSRVNAAYTSQRCSECGFIEYKDSQGELVYLKEPLPRAEQQEKKTFRTQSRNGKLFTCGNITMHPSKTVFSLDSDLNGARNVEPRPPPYNLRFLHG